MIIPVPVTPADPVIAAEEGKGEEDRSGVVFV
jgi:hypothetical protein